MRELIIFFTIYSFLGWVCETIYCFIIDKKFTYRGFLYGPVCPIYGYGALIVTACLNRFKGNIVFVFLGGMILASVLEYFTSFILEKLFNMKWWDYSKHKFNINGRVCLLNSTMFGILSVIIIEVLDPIFKDLVSKIPHVILYESAAIIAGIFIIDTIFTTAHLIHLKEHLAKIKNIKQDLKELNIRMESFAENEINKIKDEAIKRKDLSDHNNEKLEKLFVKIEGLKKASKESSRILKAFPHAKYIKDHDRLKDLKSLIGGK
ncbi:putative ABC transporter permease [Clostridium sp.]|uniref:putative ABC transporter permease n=1 Tax=Clostridium sp. TaxID=1506 RepID=UPI002FC9A8DE